MEKNDRERWIVTGAAGHLGSTVVRELTGAGREVYGLLLPGEAPKVSGPTVRYFTGDVCSPDSMRPLFENAAGRALIVIHTAALISIAEKMPPGLYAVNVEGVQNILRLCEEYKVERLVQVSSVHAIPELPCGQIMTEPAGFSPDSVVGGYAKTKAEAAQAVLDAAAAGLNAVIVLPSGILGPYDRGANHLCQMVAAYLRGSLPACVAGGYDFVDVRDVAHGCILAAQRGKAGESYILNGRYVTLKELLDAAGRICGKKPIPVLPVFLAKLAVPWIGLYTRARHRRPLYTAYSLHTVRCNSRFSGEKARRALGYTTRPLETTVRDMVEWLTQNPPPEAAE